MAKDGDLAPMKVPARIVGVDMAKDGSDETVLVVAVQTPHGKLHSIITRRTATEPCEEITPEAWERAIKEYVEMYNVPLLSKRADGDHGDSNDASGAEGPVVEDPNKMALMEDGRRFDERCALCGYSFDTCDCDQD